MKAMILAAGRGERMRPLTQDTPKPLLRIGERPLIEYHLRALRALGVSDVVINLSWLGERIRAALGSGKNWDLRIHYSDEGPVALETGGGIYKALSLLGPEPFIVINGDVWTDFPLARLKLAADATGHLVLVSNPPHHAKGDFGLEDQKVVGSADQTYTFSGIAMYRPEFFAGCTAGRFPLLPLLRRAIGAGTLSGELYEGVWSDVGTPERLEQLRSSTP